MLIEKGSLEVVEICSGFALHGCSPHGEQVFLAHLGDGVGGLPDVADPELPAAYDFAWADDEDELVDCPLCGSMGVLFPGATVGMWAGLVHWPADITAQTCDVCDGTGEVLASVAAEYEQAVME